MTRPLPKLFLACILACPYFSACADDDDTRFLLNTTQQQLRVEQQRDWVHADTPAGERRLVIEGQEYRVAEDAAGLALGIFYAINLQQWDKVEEFLSKYRLLAASRTEVILLAEGLHARARGDTATALERLRRAKLAAPGDTRIRLELARLYAEDYQSHEAIEQFEAVRAEDIPPETRSTIDTYIAAVAQRNRWHGSLSIGGGYSNNINQANGAQRCVVQILQQCFVTESLPAPVASSFLNYQLSLQKRIALGGHHNLLLRPLLYGTRYHKEDSQSSYLKDSSDNTAILYAGYNYKNARTEFSMSPYFEHYYRGTHTHYTAPGLELSLSHDVSRRWTLNAQANSKRYHYSDAEKLYFSDYTQSSAGLGANFQLSATGSLFAGVDWTRRRYPWAAASSKDQAWRIGLFKYFDNGFYLNAMALYRDSRYDERTFLSDNPRKDIQKMLIATLGMPRWRIGSIYPEIRFKRLINDSNIIHYQYRQSEASLNFKYIF
ncbi:surface lipoprotein assembly modifier [Kerstersia gyiorum]|jgi:hypothetical protein|uniref:surface lipoprotein assembly modifier n=1 Tax=Kerstersia gyiorum TaxID=206506 RepID=UPI002431CBFB|nr:surface lipoprotein assembly modifier [Kerstersia gyiorum]MCH4270120.1 surface lipoprotein assembly modifier [Kerstersia gyiorum]MCI1229272.1 surface lipoprotein assembly modifier [Kerstersia gyiorum]